MSKFWDVVAGHLSNSPFLFVLALWILFNALSGGKLFGIYVGEGQGFAVGGADCMMKPSPAGGGE